MSTTTTAAPTRMARTTVELLNVTTAYQARITYPDGRDVTIGDYPTRRMATQDAGFFIATYAEPAFRLMPIQLIDRT